MSSSDNEPTRLVAEASGLTHDYGGDTLVLDGIDLQVRSGEVLAVTGRSGSGKTTLLNLLGLLDRPSSGTIRLRGIDVAGRSQADLASMRRTHIGFVFQDSLVDPVRTSVENVTLALRGREASRGQRTVLAHACLDLVGLSHRARALASTLSGGERQRLAIARAVVGRPSLILCDEPTGNLDDTSAELVATLLQRLAEEGRAVVVVTHDLYLARRADRWAELKGGRLSWQAA